MAVHAEDSTPPVLQGQVIRRTRRRETAIVLHQGRLWVADFVDGHGVLVEAETWFRFNCGTAACAPACRRMAFESATPLSRDLARRIERLPFPRRPS
jgi:hypothetical protein